MIQLVKLLGVLGSIPYLVYIAWAAVFTRQTEGLAGRVRRWTFRLRWLILGVYVGTGLMSNLFEGRDGWPWAIAFGVGCFLCLLDRYDDDFWKRKRAKIREAVKAVGARLVVVPQPA